LDKGRKSEALAGAVDPPRAHAFRSILLSVKERKKDRRARAYLTTLVESAGDAIIAKSLDGTMTTWNKGAQRLFGYTSEEMLGKNISVLIPKGQKKEETSTLATLQRGKSFLDYETRRRRKDGSLVDISQTVSPILNSHGSVIGASNIARDITGRKRAEAELLRSQERLQLAQQMASVGSFEWNIEANVYLWSDEIQALYGVKPGTFGGTVEDWAKRVHPEDLAKAQEGLMGALKEGHFSSQWRAIWPDGSVRWLRALARVFFDGQRRPMRMVGVNIDVTERKQAEDEILRLNASLESRVIARVGELASSRADLEISNKNLLHKVDELRELNKELEAFSYSASHDLRAPLRAIEGFSRILLEDHPGLLDEEGRRIANVIITNSRRMSELIDNLLAFSRLGRQQMVRLPVDLKVLAQDTYQEALTETTGRDIRLQLGELPPANGDAAMLRQVFANLFQNAIKFTRPRDVAMIEVGGRSQGGENLYWVRDNGVGFNMKYVDRLFGVFQRLHRLDEFEGTGIGLALIQRIIHRHGGRVWGEGKQNEGATIYFTIPEGAGA
jgi:PAS domain S-box-containing protein